MKSLTSIPPSFRSNANDPNDSQYFFIPPAYKVCRGYIVFMPRHQKSGGVLCYTLWNFECPSIHPFVCPSVSAPTIRLPATPPTVLGQSFSNFTGAFRMVWRYATFFLPHLSWKLKVSFCDHSPSVVVVVVRMSVRPSTIFKQHLLLNHWLDFDQTSQEWSLVGPLSKLFKWFRSVAYLGHRS